MLSEDRLNSIVSEPITTTTKEEERDMAQELLVGRATVLAAAASHGLLRMVVGEAIAPMPDASFVELIQAAERELARLQAELEEKTEQLEASRSLLSEWLHEHDLSAAGERARATRAILSVKHAETRA